ncbi:Mitotic checkpoint protein BUB3.1 [Zea mays]|uniref:Mitotic checkpoint protein BUB3.1 n=1 Tax=Zea mays TaxID=4577 RepID=A0A317Y1I7_MAIZE|nr:Mitotic checkpoint protein BUB3.1 [Zea mays]PWZ52365.1 Mitotic checkpoint protein BUB3.1 [Zea mays]
MSFSLTSRTAASSHTSLRLWSHRRSPPPLSPFPRILSVVSWDKTVRLYDADANVLKREFMHPGAVLDCCFHDDSSGFSAGADHTVWRLVLSSSKEDVLGRHDGPVRCVEYSYAADTFISMD